jgi:hypothetical protein
VLLFNLAPAPAQAVSESVYLQSLQVAQAKLERVKHGVDMLHGLEGAEAMPWSQHAYHVGESWHVAVWTQDSSIMRSTAEPGALQSTRGRGGVFLYQVLAVTPAQTITLRITQENVAGWPPVDARVQSVELTLALGEMPTQVKKTYRLDGKDFSASPEGMHAPVTYLELFPLDAPELASAIRTAPTSFPRLPSQLGTLVGAAPHVDPAHAAQFELDDFFGRKIETIWRQGEPWPVYMNTSNGTAVLLEGR